MKKDIPSWFICCMFWLQGTFSLTAQTAIKLDEARFKKEIVGFSWSVEDTIQKKEEEMMFFALSKDSIAVIYFNIIEYIGGGYASYKFLQIKDNVFELKLSKGSLQARYVYGYQSEDKKLYILMSKQQKKISTQLFKEKDWIYYEQVDE